MERGRGPAFLETADGKLTLRHHCKLHHIGVGREHPRTPVLMLIRDRHIRIINAATGELIRELTLNPGRDYQPTGRPPDADATATRTATRKRSSRAAWW